MSTTINPYDSLGLSQTPTQAASGGNSQSLGQSDFLKLMTTQLQSQDPFKPMDSSQFLGQIAQFSTVSGIQSLNTSFSSLGSSLTQNQALQGAALVGRSVQVAGSTLALGSSGGVTASATVPASGTVTATIRDGAGAIVRTLNLGTQAAGGVDLSWDGLDGNGNRLAPGNYSLSAQLAANDGSAQALATQIVAPVTAVRLGAQGLQLDVPGAGTVSLSAVTQIR